jgi:hypothetical protein
MMAAEPNQLAELATRFGLPAFVVSVMAVIGPKVWAIVQARMQISNKKTELELATIGGASDVVTTLRTQIADTNAQLDGLRLQLKNMQETLNAVIKEKIAAEKAAQKAQSDLYIRDLLIDRLQKQVLSLGGIPVSVGGSTSTTGPS